MRPTAAPIQRWTWANALGMGLGFLAFLELLMFLSFGLDFERHWSIEAVEGLEDPVSIMRMGLVLGLPMAGGILGACQAWVLRRFLPRTWPWILTGPAGFSVVMLLIWPLVEAEIWGEIPGPVEPFTIVGGGLLTMAALQWLLLRRRGIGATRWLVLWLVGLPLGMVVFMLVYTAIAFVVGQDLSWALEVFLIGSSIGATASALSARALFGSIPPHAAGRPA